MGGCDVYPWLDCCDCGVTLGTVEGAVYVDSEFTIADADVDFWLELVLELALIV